jgi:hypothetical protein
LAALCHGGDYAAGLGDAAKLVVASPGKGRRPRGAACTCSSKILGSALPPTRRASADRSLRPRMTSKETPSTSTRPRLRRWILPW